MGKPVENYFAHFYVFTDILFEADVDTMGAFFIFPVTVLQHNMVFLFDQILESLITITAVVFIPETDRKYGTTDIIFSCNLNSYVRMVSFMKDEYLSLFGRQVIKHFATVRTLNCRHIFDGQTFHSLT